MGLFSIFKKSLPPADLSVVKTDMHSHFIPGLDDGSARMEDSLGMLEGMIELGYSKVITTPHVMTDNYNNTPDIIMDGLGKLRDAVKEAGLSIKVDAAAEYYLDYEFGKKIETDKLLTFGNKYLLWEMPFMALPDNMKTAAFDMLMQGYKPVLAHVERYPYWWSDYSKYEELKERNIILQLNINSIAGFYGNDAQKAAEWLIDNNMISFLGTDCHNKGHLEFLKEETLTRKHLHKLLESGKLLNNTL
jgi:tyrosine-protein phosphatase YwqE